MVCVSAACSCSSSPSPSTRTHASCTDWGLQLERNREALRSPAAMARSWANNISSVVAGQIRSALANAWTVKTAQKVLAASTRSDRRVADCGLFLWKHISSPLVFNAWAWVYGRRRRVLSSQANSSFKSDNHDFCLSRVLPIGLFCLSALMPFEPCDSKAPQNVSDDAWVTFSKPGAAGVAGEVFWLNVSWGMLCTVDT